MSTIWVTISNDLLLGDYPHPAIKKKSKIIQLHMYVHVASLIPRPLPVFQCYTSKNGRAWYKSACAWHHYCIMPHTYIKVFKKLPVLRYTFEKEGLLVCYLINNRTIISSRLHFRAVLAVNGSVHKTADVWPTHVQSSRFQVGSRRNFMHMCSRTRPSRFSACNTKKLGVAWGRGYM